MLYPRKLCVQFFEPVSSPLFPPIINGLPFALLITVSLFWKWLNRNYIIGSLSLIVDLWLTNTMSRCTMCVMCKVCIELKLWPIYSWFNTMGKLSFDAQHMFQKQCFKACNKWDYLQNSFFFKLSVLSSNMKPCKKLRNPFLLNSFTLH